MRKVTFAGLCAFMFLASTSIAAPTPPPNGYDLKMKLTMNGKIISLPHILTKAGEPATITQKTETQNNFIEVTAIDESILGNDGIMMTFIVGTIDNEGQRTVLFKPQVFAKENKKSEIMIEQGETKDMLSLTVVAKRKTL